MRHLISIVLLLFLIVPPAHASTSKQAERLENAAVVMEEIMNIPEGIPRDLLKKAECVAIIPDMKKAALAIGGNYGKGAMTCRVHGEWSPPVMVSITGGSFGFQIGGSSTDIVLLVMNKRGIDKLLQSKFTLGADASVAGGPKGRTATAATDAQMHAEILSYARSRGLFAGVSLDGSVLKPDREDNEDLYGKTVDAKKLLTEGGKVPGPATRLIHVLEHFDQEAKEKTTKSTGN
jgi:lipid-binding SYLF domain-containing protein